MNSSIGTTSHRRRRISRFAAVIAAIGLVLSGLALGSLPAQADPPGALGVTGHRASGDPAATLAEWTDYTVVADFSIDSFGMGLTARAKDINNAYMFELSVASGAPHFRPHKKINGGFTLFADKDISSVISTQELLAGSHTLAVTFDGSTIISSLDGTEIDRRTDTSLTAGYVGFRDGLSTKGNEASTIHSITVTSPTAGVLLHTDFSDGKNPFTGGTVTDTGLKLVAPDEVIYRWDTVAPSVSATLAPTVPDGSAGWYTGAVVAALGGADNGPGSITIQYRVDGAVAWTTLTALSDEIELAADGTHTLEYRASDDANNSSEVQSVSFKIDATAPKTTATVTTSDEAAGANTATLELAASDAHSGVASTQYAVDGGDWNDYAGKALTVSGAGDHTVAYRSTDAAGNIEGTHELAVQIDDRTTPVPGDDGGDAGTGAGRGTETGTGAGSTPVSDPGAGSTPVSEIAATGSEVSPWIFAALLLLVGGVGAVLLARSRFTSRAAVVRTASQRALRR